LPNDARPRMINCILDASAVLAYLADEEGAREVAKLLDEAAISAVNVAEVAGKLGERGAPREIVEDIVGALGLEIIDCDGPLAYRIGELRASTKGLGLSLGDRACLATAIDRGVRAVTADRHWKGLKLGVRIHVIR
jgi:ribonuclease VapC